MTQRTCLTHTKLHFSAEREKPNKIPNCIKTPCVWIPNCPHKFCISACASLVLHQPPDDVLGTLQPAHLELMLTLFASSPRPPQPNHPAFCFTPHTLSFTSSQASMTPVGTQISTARLYGSQPSPPFLCKTLTLLPLQSHSLSAASKRP